MTVRDLIEQLEQLAVTHGQECQVVVVDGEGEWPFSVHAEPEMLSEGERTVVCLDVTWVDAERSAEPESFA